MQPMMMMSCTAAAGDSDLKNEPHPPHASSSHMMTAHHPHVSTPATLFSDDELESVANRVRNASKTASPIKEEDSFQMTLEKQPELFHPETQRTQQQQQHQLTVAFPYMSSSGIPTPTFGFTPATPTTSGQAPAQYFLTPLGTATPHPWYERRTSSPQTTGEVMMALPTLSPVHMYSPETGLTTVRSISPAQSAPHIPVDQSVPTTEGSSPLTSGGTLTEHQGLMQTPVPGEMSQETLVSEIKRLREKLQSLESENANMTTKLSQQQVQVENRLAEIEMQISSGPPGPSAETGDVLMDPEEKSSSSSGSWSISHT